MNDILEFPPVMAKADDQITLHLLQAISDDSSLTQRFAAKRLGVAVGLVNSYLRRCVKKGHVKITQIPPNRYLYYLTPSGFAEKSRLSADYLLGSLTFYRNARRECEELLARCAQNGWRRVGLAGVGDLAEIATLCFHQSEAELAGVIDPRSSQTSFLGHPVVADVHGLEPLDAVLLTDLTDPQATFSELRSQMPAVRILVPAILCLPS